MSQGRLSRIEERVSAIAAQAQEQAEINLAIARFSQNIWTMQTADSPRADGSCPAGWRLREDGLCHSPPRQAWDTDGGFWVPCSVMWDEAAGAWVGDAQLDEALGMWVMK